VPTPSGATPRRLLPLTEPAPMGRRDREAAWPWRRVNPSCFRQEFPRSRRDQLHEGGRWPWRPNRSPVRWFACRVWRSRTGRSKCCAAWTSRWRGAIFSLCSAPTEQARPRPW